MTVGQCLFVIVGRYCGPVGQCLADFEFVSDSLVVVAVVDEIVVVAACSDTPLIWPRRNVILV